MKRTIYLLIGIGFYVNQFFFTYSIQLDSKFMAKNYSILFNDSLILQEIILNKYLCLHKCLIDSYCLYVKYEGKTCSLYNQDAKNNLVSSYDSLIYQKSNYDFETNIIMEPVTENDRSISCLNKSHYWSLKTNSCIPCKTGFISYSELPFSCYHSQLGWRFFSASKSHCELIGGFLFRPKTQNERFFFTRKFPYKIVYVDSNITSLGKKFKWTDGSDVVGFGTGEPNNARYPWSLIEGCLEIRSNGMFNDVSCFTYYYLTICQHD
ncbi:unnamed protein product [Brachionus calyciflorus]|uniref:C-type lectin domain-containing protein n=1 Tax=Brachionus calyciflorus TaxID=104777 RepID=A0A814JMR3_9BILA|nr:unnamed protein product [Brachionus calyciflorus]